MAISQPTYDYRILQVGTLPLRPDRRYQRVEHRCTSVLIWPTDDGPTSSQAWLTDPCFTRSGYREACAEAAALGVDPASVPNFFLTHAHADHFPCFPGASLPHVPRVIPEHDLTPPPGMEILGCPGHSEDMRALVFRMQTGQRVAVVGDAVLDLAWLQAWGYYWPNGYTPAEVVETWRSVGKLLLTADVLIPGHGWAIDVTPGLLRTLCDNWSEAEYGHLCPEVREGLLRACEKPARL